MVNMVNVQDALTWLQKGEAYLIDVREAHEFHEEHIPYALSIPLSVLDQYKDIILCKDCKIIIQCLKGGRGGRACDMLQGEGFPYDVYNLDGGITAWKEAGFSTIVALA